MSFPKIVIVHGVLTESCLREPLSGGPTTMILNNRDRLVNRPHQEFARILLQGEYGVDATPYYVVGYDARGIVAKRNARNGDQAGPSLPRTGEKAECVLLGEKTRRTAGRRGACHTEPNG
jgi:hypothetical protein